jgi:hypothetical protein
MVLDEVSLLPSPPSRTEWASLLWGCVRLCSGSSRRRFAIVITLADAQVIVPHTLGDTKLAYEVVFRSLHVCSASFRRILCNLVGANGQYALVEVGAREFLFCQEFFGMRDQKAYEAFKAILVCEALVVH